MVVYVYDGSKGTLTGASLKGVYQVDDQTVLARATNNERYSTVTLVGERANEINKLDIIKIEGTYINNWGYIIEPIVTHRTDIIETTIAIGTDGLLSECMNDGKVSKTGNVKTYLESEWSAMYKNSTPARLVFDATSFSGYIIMTDAQLPFAQCVRQLMRQGIKASPIVNGNLLEFRFHRYHVENENMFNINLDGVHEFEFENSRDTFNCLRVLLQNTEEEEATLGKYTYLGTWFLTENGSIVWNDLTKAQKPWQMRTQSYAKDLENDPTHTKISDESRNEIANQQFQNSLKISVNREWLYFYELFDNEDLFLSLGKAGKVTMPSGLILNTVIEEIEYEDEMVNITFGLGSNRLFDRIYND